MPGVPNKRGGGICIGGKVAPIFFNTAQDSGALPLRMDGERPRAGGVPPRAGADSLEVLTEVGYDADEVEALRAGVDLQADPVGSGGFSDALEVERERRTAQQHAAGGVAALEQVSGRRLRDGDEP